MQIAALHTDISREYLNSSNEFGDDKDGYYILSAAFHVHEEIENPKSNSDVWVEMEVTRASWSKFQNLIAGRLDIDACDIINEHNNVKLINSKEVAKEAMKLVKEFFTI